ncbi:TadE/TadG family type IV pilus assembly protein [Litoreibacter albidus]|uniref:TadE-like protein n=1 Tax=Litoreibacter albidus TaxID=670155 RepID=A0A1H2RH35_9RHOB|nr:TadE/TadG family type IV pilus assembly protein [Litoreibacter albidus]SDW18766.1 TadE-like protein [Litoreibacter albidus]
MSNPNKRSRMLRLWRRIMGREDGNAAVEFAIIFPIFILAFLSIFELAMIMTRYMMFDRALDVTVRQIRLSENRNFTPLQVKTLLCSQTVILRNHCMDDLRLEMHRLDADESWTFGYNDADCHDEPIEIDPVREFSTGEANDVLFIRGCMAMEPLFPTMAFGDFLIRNSSDNKLYMMASSAISVEPVN